MNKQILLQIKELMEKYGSDINEIAHKMHMDPVTVAQWIDIITDMWS
jgi:plasmid maintenance system antidote protein VapI